MTSPRLRIEKSSDEPMFPILQALEAAVKATADPSLWNASVGRIWRGHDVSQKHAAAVAKLTKLQWSLNKLEYHVKVRSIVSVVYLADKVLQRNFDIREICYCFPLRRD